MPLPLLPVTSMLSMPPGLFQGFSKLDVATNLLGLQTQGNGLNKGAGATGLFLSDGTRNLRDAAQVTIGMFRGPILPFKPIPRAVGDLSPRIAMEPT